MVGKLKAWPPWPPWPLGFVYKSHVVPRWLSFSFRLLLGMSTHLASWRPLSHFQLSSESLPFSGRNRLEEVMQQCFHFTGRHTLSFFISASCIHGIYIVLSRFLKNITIPFSIYSSQWVSQGHRAVAIPLTNKKVRTRVLMSH